MKESPSSPSFGGRRGEGLEIHGEYLNLPRSIYLRIYFITTYFFFQGRNVAKNICTLSENFTFIIPSLTILIGITKVKKYIKNIHAFDRELNTSAKSENKYFRSDCLK